MRKSCVLVFFIGISASAAAAESPSPTTPSEPKVALPAAPKAPALPTAEASKPKPAPSSVPPLPPTAGETPAATPSKTAALPPPVPADAGLDRSPAPSPRSRRSGKSERKDPSPPSLTLEALHDEIVNSPAEIEKNNLLKERDHLGELAGALDTAQKQLRKDTERLAAYLEETKKRAQANSDEEDSQKPGGSAAAKNKAASPNQPQAATPLETLAKAMRGMKPAQAAAIAERVPLSLAADVLQKMPARDAGRVLGLMNPERAAELASEIASREKATKRAL